MSGGRGGRLDANRSGTSRVARRAHQRASATRRVWFTLGIAALGPLVWLVWPVKSLFYHIPKWYVQLLLGI